MNRISSFVLIVSLMLLLGRGQAVAEPILRGAAETFPPDGHCLDTRLPDAHCASVFIDPETGSEIRTESVFHAEYGYLHGRSASEVKNWHPLLGMPQGGQAYGFFADFLTFSGPRRVGYAEILWDWGRTGESGQIPNLSYITDDSSGWVVSASVVVGISDPGYFFDTEEGEAWARITSIRLFDPEGNQITSGVYYTSESGTAYNIEGASQLPEPGTGSLLLIALAIAGWKHRRPLPPLRAARWARGSSGSFRRLPCPIRTSATSAQDRVLDRSK